uniref:Uncharacterized protein n=1 Tax=viral metagenome TaxID=1070528 RepID=A0A6M3JPM8_9ZZZZ
MTNPDKFKGMIRIIYDNPQRDGDNDIEALEWLAAHVGRLMNDVEELQKRVKTLEKVRET